jgi:hypothetical protein
MTVSLSQLGEKVYLGDFGEAVSIEYSTPCIHPGPAEFCAPERYHKIDPSFASDMWGFMYIFASLYYLGPYAPFVGRHGWSIVDGWVDTFGPLPKHWQPNYNYFGKEPREMWYDQSKEPRPEKCLKYQITKREPAINQREQNLVLSILEKGFSMSPQSVLLLQSYSRIQHLVSSWRFMVLRIEKDLEWSWPLINVSDSICIYFDSTRAL